MKIVLAADGSKCTKKALAFLVTHESICGPDDEVIVVNVQPAMPPRVRAMVTAGVLKDYQQEEAEKVLGPISRFLERHKISHRCDWAVGTPAEQVLRTVEKTKSHMVVMGTHGHGVIGRALLGSVAQKIVAGTDVPVLLVK